MNKLRYDAFFDGFIAAALWFASDDEGDSFSREDIDGDAMPTLDAYARVFWHRAKPYLQWIANENGVYVDGGSRLDDAAGHDLYLTTNSHGVGFWDRDFYRLEISDKHTVEYRDDFTKIAESLGAVNLYLGDDNKLHV